MKKKPIEPNPNWTKLLLALATVITSTTGLLHQLHDWAPTLARWLGA